MTQKFGGNWTERKLEALDRYLKAWESIFTKNERASFFKRIYLDAFAGTGSINITSANSEDDSDKFIEGSARVALRYDFDEFHFVDSKQKNISELEKLKAEYQEKTGKIYIERADANEFILSWCKKVDWKTHRAIVFLDPYGMQVNWDTVVALRATEAVDLWLLFPTGMGVMRMLTKDGEPPEGWADKITRFFGSDDWRNEFYKDDEQGSLFGGTSRKKIADFEKIKIYAKRRLTKLFGENAVAEPMELTNDKGSPMYLLFFAASNSKGAPIAVRIATYINQ